jgi:hypothetical protein
MQVFTTIFLAQTLLANIDCVDELDELDDQDLDQSPLVEFKQALRKRIAMLESRNWLEELGFED